MSTHGVAQASERWETAMSDKSPRQNSKKAGKTLKEKRADKHAKADAKNHLDIGQIGKK